MHTNLCTHPYIWIYACTPTDIHNKAHIRTHVTRHPYAWIYANTCTYAHIYALTMLHICTLMYAHIHVSANALIHMNTHIYNHPCTWIYALAHTHTCTQINKHVHVCTHPCTCAHNTHIHIYRCKVGPISCESVSMSLSKKCFWCMSWWTTQIWLIVYILNVCMLLRESKIHRNIL